MSKGRARIVVRFNDEEMRMVKAAADVTQVQLQHLARMGILKEVMDIRTRLIEQLQKEKAAREQAARETNASDVVQAGESSGVSGSALDGSTQGSNDSGTQPQL